MGKWMRGVLACGLLGAALILPALQVRADESPKPTVEEKQRADKATKLNKEGMQLYGMVKEKEGCGSGGLARCARAHTA